MGSGRGDILGVILVWMRGPEFQPPTLYSYMSKNRTFSYINIIKCGPIHILPFKFPYLFTRQIFSNICWKRAHILNQQKWLKKYLNIGIKITIYRYGKLQKLETWKEGHSYIDQVKRGLIIYILIKMEIDRGELKKGAIQAAIMGANFYY